MKEEFLMAEISDDGKPELLVFDENDVEDAEAYRRVVACVNACVGIPVQDLEGCSQFAHNGSSLMKKLVATRNQRDNLLLMLHQIKKIMAQPYLLGGQQQMLLSRLNGLPESFD